MLPRQLPLLKRERIEHGGDVRARLRKEQRPFSPKCSMHVVMRSNRAKGTWSLLHHRNRSSVERLVYKWANAKGVKVYRFANVGNHIHLLVKSPSREALQRFLKTFAGLCARAVTGARKGLSFGKFWEATAYSRLVSGGAFRAITGYFEKNDFEAIGFRGARLRLRASGKYVVVTGDAPPGTADQVEALIRGSPA
jgi:REP element-mobilizing transposase RayT